MKHFFNNIQTLLIVVLVIIIVFLRSCSARGAVKPEIITKIEIKYDTIQTIKETYIPKWKTKVVTEIVTETITETDTFQQPIDTLAILQDYYTKYFYQDTIEIVLYLLDLFNLTHSLGEIDFCKTCQSSNGLSEL